MTRDMPHGTRPLLRPALALLSATILLTACEAPQRVTAPADRPSASTATTQEITRIPYSVLSSSSCLGEAIELTGNLLVVRTATENESIERRFQHLSATDITGVGLSTGTTYVGIDISNDQQASTPGASVVTRTLTFLVTDEGGVPKLVLHTLVHVTEDAAGEHGVVVLKTNEQCVGPAPGGGAPA